MRLAAEIETRGILIAAAFALSGCLVYDVASTTVGAATTVVGTTVDVAAGAICTVACSADDEKKK